MDKIQKAIYDAVNIVVEEKLKNLKYNYTKIGVVKSVSGNKAVVTLDDMDSICNIRSGLKLYPDDIVIVMIKQNDYSVKYVDGKLMEMNEELPPGIEDIADAVAKKHLPEEVGGHRITISSVPPQNPKYLDVWIDIGN